MDIEWEDPPERQSGQMVEFIAELRKHPGKWGKYPTTFKAYSNVTMYRNKYQDIEFRPVTIGKQQVSVWARCREVPDDQA